MEPYPNPPIKEALIDIRTVPLSQSSLPILEGLHEQIKAQYPTKTARMRWSGSVRFEESQLVSSAQKNLGCDGYLFHSSDNRQIVQYRLDGFTFNRLRPYPRTGWPVIREEAYRLWELYVTSLQPAQVIRIGLRYINEIEVPLAQIDLQEYLTASPDIPDPLPQTLEHFLSRIVIPWSDLNAKSIITQSLSERIEPDKTSIILDIDVLTEQHMKPDTAKVWHILDRFRDVKNKIFKASITRKTEDLFQ